MRSRKPVLTQSEMMRAGEDPAFDRFIDASWRNLATAMALAGIVALLLSNELGRALDGLETRLLPPSALGMMFGTPLRWIIAVAPALLILAQRPLAEISRMGSATLVLALQAISIGAALVALLVSTPHLIACAGLFAASAGFAVHRTLLRRRRNLPGYSVAAGTGLLILIAVQPLVWTGPGPLLVSLATLLVVLLPALCGSSTLREGYRELRRGSVSSGEVERFASYGAFLMLTAWPEDLARRLTPS